MKVLIRNIGQIVSGDIAKPLLDGDSIVAADGKIVAVGRGLDDDADTVIDARGSTVVPGLIDSHCHPVFGDFTPRQRTIDFIESGLNGGITTMISAGEVHLPGRPKDIVGLKALAIVAAKSYANQRPAGVKMHAGAPILELGMVEEDFAEMARAGVKLVGEIGLGSVRTGKDAAPMVKWAKKHGMTVTIHTGGPSIAGSNAISRGGGAGGRPRRGRPHQRRHHLDERARDRRPGGDPMALEIVHCGNGKAALHALPPRPRGGRPTASSSASTRRPAPGWCRSASCACSPTWSRWARSRPRRRSAWPPGTPRGSTSCPTGVIAPGRDADLCIVDAPIGSQGRTALEALQVGDLFGVSMILIDGQVKIGRSRNTPPATRAAEVVRGQGPAAGGH